MRFFSAATIDAALDFPSLIAALAEAFRGGAVAPQRAHYTIERAGEPAATHLVMPAWTPADAAGDAYIGVKIVNVFPGNGARSLPAVHGVYILQSGKTGETLAAMDGARLTLWRTAAASALAAKTLAREDARRLLLVGAGSLAPFLAKAHASVRPIGRIGVWNRNTERARALARSLNGGAFEAHVVEDLERGVRDADIVSCATLATAPLIKGAWLKAGCHLDLVGAFNMSMREADDAALKRARIFVDTESGLSEGGDVAQAIRDGTIVRADVAGDLAALTRGEAGRGAADEITLFKSVGASIEDLAAAMLVWKKAALPL